MGAASKKPWSKTKLISRQRMYNQRGGCLSIISLIIGDKFSKCFRCAFVL